MLAIAAPLVSLICLVVGMAHQIRIILTKGYSEELSIPRIFLGIFSGIIWALYGFEIKNDWLIALNVAGIIMNLALVSIIYYLRKNRPTF